MGAGQAAKETDPSAGALCTFQQRTDQVAASQPRPWPASEPSCLGCDRGSIDEIEPFKRRRLARGSWPNGVVEHAVPAGSGAEVVDMVEVDRGHDQGNVVRGACTLGHIGDRFVSFTQVDRNSTENDPDVAVCHVSTSHR